MVDIDVPKHCSASPSSYGTPHLTINRHATVDLDSSNAFEGPEKLLEVWFCASPAALPQSAAPNGLKDVNVNLWKDMLDLVDCKILSVIEHDHVDAYLLSESSMFVFPHKLVLKTCGTTTLLCGLSRMLEIAAVSAGFPHAPADPVKLIPSAATPFRVFYSRKNFHFPDQQRGPHRSWRDEVRFLDRVFKGGSAYMIGKMNGEHWYLYITGPAVDALPGGDIPADETETKFIDAPPGAAAAFILPQELGVDEGRDETLEILMTDLDQTNARQFYFEDASIISHGRYSEQSRKAHKAAISHLGNLSEPRMSVGSNSSDDFDLLEPHLSDSSTSLESFTASDTQATEGHALGTVVAETSGVVDVYPPVKYPDARVDSYLFSPCGFSANGVVPAPNENLGTNYAGDGSTVYGESNGTHYFTIHVTPEPHCSYASFETNVPSSQSGRRTADIIEQVIRIFQPGRFSVTLFESKTASTAPHDSSSFGREVTGRDSAGKKDHIPGYRRVDRIVHDLDGYDLVFLYFERLGWQGSEPRIGEDL